MSDTYAEVWGRVLLRAPNLGPKLAQDMARNAFRQLAERRRWSWLTQNSQIIAPAVTTTGTVTVTLNSLTVTGSGTSWTSALVGQQFRVGLNTPIYTIVAVPSATQLTLDQVWGTTTASAQTYEIYQCFFSMPDDFHQHISVYDPAYQWQLILDISQNELNMIDAQRANSGNAYVVSFRSYSTSQIGRVAQPIQVFGSGPSPNSGGTYTAPVSALFTVEITTSGAAGTAVYRWKKDAGSYTSSVTTDSAGDPQDLQDGVQVQFPLGETYVDGDQWVIQATALAQPGTPVYELWPHQKGAHVYGMLYSRLPTDISALGAVIPRAIPGDLLVQLAMAEVARYPGTDTQKNPYFNTGVARMLDIQNEERLNLIELRDDEVSMQNLTYQYPQMSWGYAAVLGDSRWLQSHSI